MSSLIDSKNSIITSSNKKEKKVKNNPRACRIAHELIGELQDEGRTITIEVIELVLDDIANFLHLTFDKQECLIELTEKYIDKTDRS